MEENLIQQDYAIKTYALTKEFGSHGIAVNKLDLSIKEGEIFSLLGPNGAGKTTTIKMLCCLMRPTRGRATIMGQDIVKNPYGVKEIINVSPQESAVAANLRVQENLILIGIIYGLGKKQARLQSLELLEIMDLSDRRDDLVKKLSGGMLRRLSIAMALMSDPKVLFLDEPTIGLDAQSRRSLWSFIQGLKGKKTVLLTTHYLEEADYLADKIAIMHEGNLVAFGTSEELKQRLGVGMETMSIKAHNLTSKVLEDLKRSYSQVTAIDGGLIIKDKNLNFDDTVDLLRHRGVKIQWLSMAKPTLEEVYLEMTRRDKSEGP